jgi:spore coat protein U-like protein
MKKVLAISAAVAVLAVAGSAFAAGSNTLTVSASVTETCKFVDPSSTLAFGALDPSASADATATVTTKFWCTKGVSTDAIAAASTVTALDPTTTTGATLKGATTGNVDSIPYTLILTKSGTNLGPGTPRDLKIDGKITNANYINKTADSYSDTVTLTITP